MHLQLEGTSLADLEAQVRVEFGPDAEIVHVDKVTVGGIRGFFARQHYEVVVEVPDRRREAPVAPPRELLDVPARAGLAALLTNADEAEAELNPPPVPSVSTGSEVFARILDDLTHTTGVSPAPAAPSVLVPAAPSPLHGAGDLVVIVGLDRDPYIVASALAIGGNPVTVSGALAVAGLPRVEDRRTAIAARVRGVRGGHSVFVAVGLGSGEPTAEVSERAASIGALAADQVWAAVDARKRADETAAWMRAVAAVVTVDAVAVVGA